MPSNLDARKLFNRSAMVLYALEQSLGGYVTENISEVDELPEKQTKRFTKRDEPLATVGELVQETYISEVLDMAISAANQVSDKAHLQRIKTLADCLELYEIRNAVAHPNRPFPDCYWYRLSALANDPAIAILGFSDVKHAFDSAINDSISLPPEEWFSVYAFSLPNNLPRNYEHELTGLIGRDREKADLLKKMKKKRFSLVALVGPGGTGKTAIALQLLQDASLEPATLDWAEQIIYVTAKTEQLTKDGPIPIDNPIVSACTLFSDKSILVCLDNLETLLRDHPESFDEFYEILPEKWRVLVTSRVPVESATNVPINPIRADAGKRLATSYAFKRGENSLGPDSIERLVEKTKCNPLAIRISIDGIVAGLDVNQALSQTKDSILDFSYTNLLSSLPPISNKILECLFAANDSLSRSDIRFLLENDSDTVATGLQALTRTSLISRHAGDSVESYSLSNSIRDLLLRNPLDESTRHDVFQRLANRRQQLEKFKSDDRPDPLDSDHIPGDCLTALIQPLLAAFQMRTRKVSKAAMADALDELRGELREHNEAALYRAIAGLHYELDDRTSARQILEQASHRESLDPAARLVLAEYYKHEKLFEKCSEIASPLIDEGWFNCNKTSRGNLARIARVTWLVDIWRGKANEVVLKTRDWKKEPISRATKGAIYLTAVSRLMEEENDSSRVLAYFSELVDCMDEIFREDGYVGFVVAESVKIIQKINEKLSTLELTPSLTEKLSSFADCHLISICNVHKLVSIKERQILEFLQHIQAQAKTNSVAGPKAIMAVQDAEDPALSKYGYVAVEVYHRPKDTYGNKRGFLFAKDKDGNEYHVSSRAMIDTEAFNSLEDGDMLNVLPRDDCDEGKAQPVRDAIPFA